jgi:hypothetical protein
MKYTRRNFIKFGGLAGLAVGTIPVLAKGAFGLNLSTNRHNAISEAFIFQNATFQNLVGSDFIVYSDDSAATSVLREVEILDPVRKGSGECFSLSFEMPTNNFSQNTYRMFHPTIGYFELFAVPGLHDNGMTTLTAIVNRI